jgi:hypothetical protein
MSLGWLWFFLSLGAALMVAALQQLAPIALVFWAGVFALGAVLVLFSATAYLLRHDRT